MDLARGERANSQAMFLWNTLYFYYIHHEKFVPFYYKGYITKKPRGFIFLPKIATSLVYQWFHITLKPEWRENKNISIQYLGTYGITYGFLESYRELILAQRIHNLHYQQSSWSMDLPLFYEMNKQIEDLPIIFIKRKFSPDWAIQPTTKETPRNQMESDN